MTAGGGWAGRHRGCTARRQWPAAQARRTAKKPWPRTKEAWQSRRLALQREQSRLVRCHNCRRPYPACRLQPPSVTTTSKMQEQQHHVCKVATGRNYRLDFCRHRHRRRRSSSSSNTRR
jgi:hypothetical protein